MTPQLRQQLLWGTHQCMASVVRGAIYAQIHVGAFAYLSDSNNNGLNSEYNTPMKILR